MGKTKVPYLLRVFLSVDLWRAIEEFSRRSGRSLYDQEKFFFEAATNAIRRLKNFNPVPEQDWGSGPEFRDDRYRTKFAMSKEDRSLLIERQESEDIKYTALVRDCIAAAVEAAHALPESLRYAARKEVITELIVRKYRHRFRATS